MQQRDVVKLNGKPEQVELLYSSGKEGRNDRGVYYAWGLAQNKVIFAPPALNEAIQSLNPRKGMKLSIQLGEGNRWDVRPIEPPAEQPRQIATASAAPQAAVEQHPKGNTARIPDAPYSHTGWAAHIRDQAQSLIDVAASCHRYAAEKYPGLLTGNDVADLVITTYINHSKSGGCQ